ncbi:MAG: hypothetical protein LQ339_004652 [Xanthoria mediterranea]|nr:MAG: hypothetical protein LQ339_004652 [Xanthoria mediterranea]
MAVMIESFSPITFGHDELFPPHETVSMAETTLKASTPDPSICDTREDGHERKPVKKRKSWGQELPTPKTNLPPRKRAKTEDEKEQRRIERVLRNRQAAQSSRERKRQEVEKLEGEKHSIEEQNDMLKQRVLAAEHEKFQLQQQNTILKAELAALRSGSTSTRPLLASSPDSAMELFNNQQAIKKELDDSLTALRTPISLPSDTFSPSPSSSLDDVVRPAVSIRGGAVSDYDSAYGSQRTSTTSIQPTKPHYPSHHPIVLSDPHYNGLFAAPLSPPADISFFEDGFASVDPCDDPSSHFTFDSMVDLDAGGSNDSLINTKIIDDSIFNNNNNQAFFQDDDTLQADLPNQTAPTSPALQPCLGAPSSGCDGSGNAS